MIVQCEQCKRRFRLDPGRMKAASARVRCSQCQHVFTVTRPEDPDLEPAAVASPEVEPQAYPGPRSNKRLLVLLVPLLLVAVGVAIWNYLPDLQWFKKPPAESTGIEKLHLLEPRSYFIENEKAGQLFVIEGRVRNDFPVPRRWIHLRAKLYTDNGHIAQQVDFYAGNPLSDQQLRSMPLTELQNLIQRHPAAGEGDKTIGSQEEMPFAVPFGNLPELSSLSDYSVEILASQPSQ